MTLYYGQIKKTDGTIYLVVSEEGLCYIGSENRGLEEVKRWAEKSYPNTKLVEDWNKVEKYAKQLMEYLEGKRKTFDLDIILSGTAFQEAVWSALQSIPYGETRTYSEIAEYIGRKRAVRAVGSAIGANPIPIVVPCHRVISKSGQLSGFRGGVEMKRKLLKIEGANTNF